MKFRLIVVLSCLFLLCTSSVAQDGSENYVLTVRKLPNAEYEAVISYDTDVFCFLAVTPAASVEVIGSEVRIVSPVSDKPIYCFTPPPPYYYFEETALIGDLAPGNYTVTWVQPEAFSLSTPLGVGLSGESSIPSNSTWALFLLILGILAVAHFSPRLNLRSKPT